MPRRRFRGRDSYARRAPSREPYDAVLIVCEGTKTEKYYFDGLKAAHRLSSANIEIAPLGKDPLSVVTHAISELERDDTLTRAYCVFDRDGHATYGDAIRKAGDHKLGKNGRLKLAVSVPCFEVWPLLHFRYTTQPIEGAGNHSPGDRTLSLVQQEMPDYSKCDRAIFEKLSPKLKDALQRAKKLATHNAKSASDNPATEVHCLVQYLIGLKR